jgi:16S rRNA (cytidine1402-2'-O)-methyltransferase
MRELTKIHEEVLRGRADEIAERLAEIQPRGEITLVVEGAALRRQAGQAQSRHLSGRAVEPAAHLRRLLNRGLSRRDAARSLAETYGIPRRVAYRMALEAGKS